MGQAQTLRLPPSLGGGRHWRRGGRTIRLPPDSLRTGELSLARAICYRRFVATQRALWPTDKCQVPDGAAKPTAPHAPHPYTPIPSAGIDSTQRRTSSLSVGRVDAGWNRGGSCYDDPLPGRPRACRGACRWRRPTTALGPEKPFEAFANGVRLWQTELLAYIDEPTTNGYAEGVINKVNVVKRRAYGIPTFATFRNRILLACG